MEIFHFKKMCLGKVILSAKWVPLPLAKKGPNIDEGFAHMYSTTTIPETCLKHKNSNWEIFLAMFLGLWQTHKVSPPVKFDKVSIKQRRNIGKRTFQGYPDETTHWLIEMSTLSQQWAVGAQPHNFPLLSF